MRAYFEDGEDKRVDEAPLHLGIPANVTELARFGIVHNLIHNRDIVESCTDSECESGPLKIAGKYVAETVRKFFGFDLDAMDLSPIAENPSVVYAYDGEFYHFDAESFSEPGEDAVYNVRVQDIDEGGRYISASGYVYDTKRPSRKARTFSAFVRPNGKGWMIISMTTRWNRDGGIQ